MPNKNEIATQLGIDLENLPERELKLTPDGEVFNPEVINELLDQNMLTIKNDITTGILIKLRVPSSTLTPIQRKELSNYTDAVLRELEAFKKEFGITMECKSIKQDAGGIYSVLITLPNFRSYNAFLQRLVDKNLLPASVLEKNNQLEIDIQKENRNDFAPTPFSKRLIPGQSKNKNTEEEEEEKNQLNDKRRRPKSPKDGLKPKGFE